MIAWLRRRRLAHLRATPLPDTHRELLATRLPRYARMSPAQREALEQDVSVFLAEKTFVGCAGVEVTDEMRVVIAGEACVLLLGRDEDEVFPEVHTILVYPTAWFATATSHLGGGMRVEGRSARLGEAWVDGQILLAWDAVTQGVGDPDDGRSVVLHEFAHALDHEDGAGDGAPVMPYARVAAWATVFGRAWEDLHADLAAGRRHVLREYAATNPAEFFAVATEVFFERGAQLRRDEPALHEALVAFYGQAPDEADA